MPYSHDRQLSVLRSILVDDILPGQIVRFNYRDKSGNFSKRNVLTIISDDGNGKFHALDLSRMSDREIYEISERFANELSANAIEEFEDNLPVIYINADASDEDILSRLYEQNIKPFRFTEHPYRTFSISNMSTAYILEYRTRQE